MPAAKIVPGRKYTRAQLRELIDSSTAQQLQFQGYVLRYDALDQTYTVAKYSPRHDGKAHGTVQFEPDEPVKKRTALERRDSLMLKLVAQSQATGKLPAQDDPRWREILGEAWKNGNIEITTDVIMDVARRLLEKSEKQHDAKLATQVTRHED